VPQPSNTGQNVTEKSVNYPSFEKMCRKSVGKIRHLKKRYDGFFRHTIVAFYRDNAVTSAITNATETPNISAVSCLAVITVFPCFLRA